MFGLAHLRSTITSRALRFDEFDSIDELTAAIALITFSIIEVTHRALTTNETISQEARALKTVLLVNNLLKSVALSLQFFENILCDFSLDWGTSAPKLIKVTIEPIVNLFVQSIVFIANLLGGHV